MTNSSSGSAANVKPMAALAPKLTGSRHRMLYWCVIGLLALIMFVAGTLSLAVDVLSLGIVPYLMAATGAVLLVPIYLGVFLWLDRFEPEPPELLLLAFFWGCTVSIFGAGCLNSIIDLIIWKVSGNKELAEQLTASLSAPLMEETFKGTALLLLFVFRKDQFDGVLDGIIYAGVTALGFAMAENVEYYGRAMHEGGALAFGVSYILRGLMSPYTHVLFTSMTGIGFGLAVSAKNPLLKFVLPVVGWMLAMTLHFLWNTIPAVGQAALGGGAVASLGTLLVSYVVFWVPVFGCLMGLVFWSLRKESRMIGMELQHYVEAGELSEAEAVNLAKLWPRMIGSGVGPTANTPWGIRRKYTRLVTELAFYRHRVATGHIEADPDSEALHLQELRKLRAGR